MQSYTGDITCIAKLNRQQAMQTRPQGLRSSEDLSAFPPMVLFSNSGCSQLSQLVLCLATPQSAGFVSSTESMRLPSVLLKTCRCRSACYRQSQELACRSS